MLVKDSKMFLQDSEMLVENSNFILKGQRLFLTYCFPLNSSFSKEEFLIEINSLVFKMKTEILCYYVVEEHSKNSNIPTYPKNPVEKKHFHAILILKNSILITNQYFLDINNVHGNYVPFFEVLKHARSLKKDIDSFSKNSASIIYKNLRGFEKIILYLLKQDKNPFINLSTNSISYLSSLARDISLKGNYLLDFCCSNVLSLPIFTIDEYKILFPRRISSKKTKEK